jgi:pimeloyl-ACP methyl ester carboxylesterase
MRKTPWIHAACSAAAGLLLLFTFLSSTEAQINNNANGNQVIRLVMEYQSFTQVAGLSLTDLPEREAWRQVAPAVEEISIPRANGEADQPALWYHSGTSRKKPLLLVLHSWSDNYLQHYGIPYGVFAVKNDWILMHPNFRGPFNNAAATASEKAVRDVLDALEYAKAHAPVDAERIYLAGFSGGAMMSLVMTGRYPENFTAAVIWVPVYDLNDWYARLVPSPLRYTIQYGADIEASCGGNPLVDATARAECAKRSPSAYLVDARGKGVRFYVSGGLQDPFVPPSHAIRAFNDLVAKEHRIPEADYRFIDENKALPENLSEDVRDHPLFDAAGLPVVLTRTANDATLILFDGGHDIAYNAGLEWLARQTRSTKGNNRTLP